MRDGAERAGWPKDGRKSGQTIWVGLKRWEEWEKGWTSWEKSDNTIVFRNFFSNILQYVIVSLHFFGPWFCFRIWDASIKGTFTSSTSMSQNLSLFQKQLIAVVLIQHHVFVPCQSGGFSLRYGTPLGNWYGTREFYMSKHVQAFFSRFPEMFPISAQHRPRWPAEGADMWSVGVPIIFVRRWCTANAMICGVSQKGVHPKIATWNEWSID